MRYLKSFNENLFESYNSEDIQEIVNNCKDILLDLKDDGFEISIIPFYIEGNSLCFNV